VDSITWVLQGGAFSETLTRTRRLPDLRHSLSLNTFKQKL